MMDARALYGASFTARDSAVELFADCQRLWMGKQKMIERIDAKVMQKLRELEGKA